MTVAAAHVICDRIEDTLKADMGHLMVSIHVEPEEKAKPGAVRVAEGGCDLDSRGGGG
jgi:divalent metal cation (Fe/Co/Zn/Cd) transporter